MAPRDDRRERSASLIARVEASFGAEAPPARDLLIVQQDDERAQAEAETFRDEVAGRRWEELDEAWLHEHWAHLCYLTPEAWRAYVPALLRVALRQVPVGNPKRDDTPGWLITIVCAITPSAWFIHHGGEDERHEARVAALTPEQFDVVCAFLELLQTTWLPFFAADAMRWGWSQRETPHHAWLRAHDARLAEYEWPKHEDPNVASLIERIRAAFAGRPYPGDAELCGEGAGLDPPEAALSFQGRDWRTIHPEFLDAHLSGRFFLSDAAYCYYLPALLIHALHDDHLGPLWDLTGVTDEDGFWATSLEDLGAAECEVVVAWMRHQGAWDPDEKEGIDRALEEYWLPKLEAT